MPALRARLPQPQRTRGLHLVLAIVAALAGSAHADGPSFDRPGIAFSPATLPRHAFAWEQGLPDFERDTVGGVTQSAYAANTRLRYGLTDAWEVQLAIPLFERFDTSGTGRGLAVAGTGDVSLAIKRALASGDGPFSAAALAVVSVPTGKQEFSNGSAVYSLGTTASWAVNEGNSLALLVNADVMKGDATWTISPNWSFSLGDTVGAYVEAGWQFPPHGDPTNEVAGGGFTWLVKPTVQLDIFGLAGLTKRSTDLTAGWGVSWFVP